MVAIQWPLNTAPGKNAQDGAGRLINVFPEQRQNGQGIVWRRAPGATSFTNTYPFTGSLTGTGAVAFVGDYVGLTSILDNLYAVHSTRRVIDSYAGALIRLRRSSDNTEQDFSPAADGWVSASSINTFLGSGVGYVCKMYDQSGNSRHAIQAAAAAQPPINIGGDHVSVSFNRSIGHQLEIQSATAFAQNIGAVSLIAVRKFNSAASGNSQLAIFVSSGTNFNQARAALLQNGVGDVFCGGGRRTDADSLDTTTGFARDLAWNYQICRFDYSNAVQYNDVGTSSETDATFQTAGLTSNTASLAVRIGGAGQISALGFDGDITLSILVQDLITAGEVTSLSLALKPFLVTTHPGVLSTTGTATVSFGGQNTQGVIAFTGTAAVSLVGAPLADGIGAMTGSGNAAFVGVAV